MQPNYYNQPGSSLHLRRYVLLGLILLFGVVSLLTYRASVFHVVRTDPKTSNFANIAPYLKVYFNDKLADSNLAIADSGKIVSDYNVNGKVLTLNFAHDLTIGKRYSITIQHIENLQGEQIENKILSFTAKDIKYESLSKEMQNEIVARQDNNEPYSVYSIVYTGFDSLTNNGLTSDQLQSVKQALYSYSGVLNKQFKTEKVIPGSVVVTGYNPEASDPSAQMHFTLTVDNTSYNATVRYSPIDDTASIVLRDGAGKVVYDPLNAPEQQGSGAE